MPNQIRNTISVFTIRSTIKGKLNRITLFLLMSFSACTLIFTPDELGLAQLKTEKDYVQAINGVYGLLTASFDLRHFYVNSKGDDLAIRFSQYYEYVPTDRMYKEYLFDSVSNTCIDQGRPQYSQEFDRTKYIWIDLYKVIASSNNLINQFNPKETNIDIKYIAGEAFLIRAYCYLRLTRTYGEIPLIENNDVDYIIAKSTFQDIYEFIELDLLTAMRLLPENNALARVPMVTPHKGTALAIMAELYLSWAGYPIKDDSKYDLAAKTAEKVIDNMDSYGMGLMGDFADLWKRENLYNKESILSVYYPYLTDEDKKYRIGYLFQGEFDTIFSYRNRFGFYSTEYQFYNNYPKNYRRDITFFNTIKYFNYIVDEENESYSVDTIDVYIDQMEPCREISYRKFYYEPICEESSQGFGSNQKCWGNQRLYIFRFAHTLLTYAEASARSGQLDAKAYECVNMIRRRANNLDIHTPSQFDMPLGLSPKVFANSVVWERAWELAGEPEGRWFDLVRLEMAESLPQLKGIIDGDFPLSPIVTKDDYYFPIPEEEIFLNPFLSE